MLERYFLLPKTVDRYRTSWFVESIERYVAWLAVHDFSRRSVTSRVSLIAGFADFARRRGARDARDLARHLDAFVRYRLRHRPLPFKWRHSKRTFVADVRRPIEHMLRIMLPGQQVETDSEPLARWAPCFFAHLREERGLQEATIQLYRYHLAKFEKYAARRKIRRPDEVTVAVLDGFIAEARRRNCPEAMGGICSVMRAFLRYLFREERIRVDLSAVVERPRTYRLSGIPRSVSWDDVIRTLKCIDRRSVVGKRDFAMLLLLAVYGLRAREVAALTLDDIQWRAETLFVRGRKAGHSTSYPLAQQVRDALVDYLRCGRPTTTDRHVFLVLSAPRRAVTSKIVADRAHCHLQAAAVQAPRLGSHTFRHSVAQRLVDSDFSLKVIGDYLGHRSPSSTQIYGKVSIESLRELALGDGEAIL